MGDFMQDTQTVRRGLEPLSGLADYRVAKGNPDIRGWRVFGADGVDIGRVRDLIVDCDAMKVRFVVIGLTHGLLAAERQVLVPIERARLDDVDDLLVLDDVDATRLGSLPDYDLGALRKSRFVDEQKRAEQTQESKFWGRRRDASREHDRYLERELQGTDATSEAEVVGGPVVVEPPEVGAPDVRGPESTGPVIVEEEVIVQRVLVTDERLMDEEFEEEIAGEGVKKEEEPV